MKRLIPAAIILVFTICICICSQIYVDHACDKTLSYVEEYYNQTISHTTLEQGWKHQKEKLSLFVNHNFLDKVSIYIGQLTTTDGTKDEKFHTAYQNIKTVLSMIIEEQMLAPHSFY